MSSAFYQRVFGVVAGIPPGKVVTYGQIARHLGQPRGARVVGWAMKGCPDDLPWYRVVNSHGEISSRAHDAYGALQRTLLESEGVSFDAAGRVDLARFGWDGI